jgi:hypothetical protein
MSIFIGWFLENSYKIQKLAGGSFDAGAPWFRTRFVVTCINILSEYQETDHVLITSYV